jgi:aldehyde dehydrogenase (NAD+)
VCLIISPWNYPFNLAMTPLVSAIAAGNTAIIKPSEMTPHVSALLQELVSETFDQQEVAVFQGDHETAQALLALPFDHIFFTGSPAVGRIVMAAAAQHLASVTLELGGKSPVIVDRSADLRQAARDIMWGKLANNGQTCIAPDHLYVHESVRDDFVAEAEQAVRRAYGDSAPQRQASPDYCRIVNQRHFQRLQALIEDAQAQGASTLFGGQLAADERYISPTLLGNVPDQARLMQEEIFGPVLPVLPYSDIDQVIAAINARPKPLALYLFARDETLVEKVLGKTSAGGSCINHNLLHYLNGQLPFGGVNNSGIGKTHGVHGFREFSNQRAVLRAKRSIAHWLYPPYTPRVQKLSRLVLRYLR